MKWNGNEITFVPMHTKQVALHVYYFLKCISLTIVVALRMDSNCPLVDITGNSLGHHRYLIKLTKALQILHGLVTCV